MSLGLSWPFFFLLKRLFTITAGAERATITVGVTADSQYSHAYCYCSDSDRYCSDSDRYCSDSDCYCSCSGSAIFSMHDSHVSHYSFLTVIIQSYIKI